MMKRVAMINPFETSKGVARAVKSQEVVYRLLGLDVETFYASHLDYVNLEDYDLIHVHGPLKFGRILKVWRSSAPAVLTIHGWVLQEVLTALKVDPTPRRILYCIYTIINWILHRLIFIRFIYKDRVTCVSEITKKKNHCTGATVIPNALITDEIEERVRECPEFHRDGITAVTYTSFGGSKVLSIQRFAEIISKVNKKSGCRIRLLVFGEESSKIEDKIEDDCIEFMGYRDDFLCYVRSADIMLLGYDMSELGYAVLEAGYLGVPVAKFRGEFEELQDDVHGIIAEDDGEMIEKLSRFIENPSKGPVWGEKLREHITETRNPRRIADKWARLLGDIMK